jgi:CDP-ribitol ribitolphosphotransferase
MHQPDARDPAVRPRALLVVESCHFDRILLTVSGRVDGDPSSLAGASAYFVDSTGGERYAAGDLELSETTFKLRSRIMHVAGGKPLHTATWRLVLADEVTLANREAADEAAVGSIETDVDREEREAFGDPVWMDEAFRIDPRAYGGLFTYGRVRYWIVPSADRITGGFALAISYRINKGKTPKGWRRLRHTIRSMNSRIRNAVFRKSVGFVRRVVPHNGKRILFTSDSRRELSGNLLHIYQRMCERGLDREYTLMRVFKESIKARRPFVDKFRFVYGLAVADVILLDDYQPMLYKVDFPPETKIVQVWHASGAFKTVGYSRIGKSGGPEPFSSAHKIYTHAIVNSEHDVPFYAEAFGVPEERVHATGIPRTDLFFDTAEREAASERAYHAFPLARGRQTILFAPTFRGRGPSDAHYDFDALDLDALYAVCEELDACVIFKHHPFVLDAPAVEQRFSDRFVDATDNREINDILMISDLVITDYSSLVFEYSTLGRPMIFFAYDLEEYEAVRDFYEPLTAFAPGKIVRSFDDLLAAIRSGDFEQEKVAEFAARHFAHTDGRSSDRVIDQIVLG